MKFLVGILKPSSTGSLKPVELRIVLARYSTVNFKSGLVSKLRSFVCGFNEKCPLARTTCSGFGTTDMSLPCRVTVVLPIEIIAALRNMRTNCVIRIFMSVRTSWKLNGALRFWRKRPLAEDSAVVSFLSINANETRTVCWNIDHGLDYFSGGSINGTQTHLNRD